MSVVLVTEVLRDKANQDRLLKVIQYTLNLISRTACVKRVRTRLVATSTLCGRLRQLFRLTDSLDDVKSLLESKSVKHPLLRLEAATYALMNLGSDLTDFLNLICTCLHNKFLAELLEYWGSICWLFSVAIEMFTMARSTRASLQLSQNNGSEREISHEEKLRRLYQVFCMGRILADAYCCVAALSERLDRFKVAVDLSYIVSGLCGLACAFMESIMDE